MKKLFIGVAWPYANGPLHLGHIAGSILPPDIFARYNRMIGNDVLMVSGSDEHGTPITIHAEKEGISPQELVDKYHNLTVNSLNKLGITFSLFFRTSHPNHKKVVQNIFLKLLEKGYIYEKETLEFHCSNCNRFLPDRYVEGVCPYCNFEDARGDQCDECGKTLNAEELLKPRCKICSSQPSLKKTVHFFLKLSSFAPKLFEYIKDKKHWKKNVYKFTLNWLEDGLKDRAVTRDLTWGVEIPMKGYETKRIYVWFEAVCGYFTTSIEWARRIGKPDKWKEFWMDKNVKHYYFMGKDNIPFHTIIWPSILMGYGDLNLPYDIPANEYLTLGKEQFSKSRQNAVWIPDYLKYYDPDALRYYLSINMPETKDTEFTWEDFVQRNNSELVGTLGNFVHRTLSFTYKNFGEIPKLVKLEERDKKALEEIKKSEKIIKENIEKCRFKRGMKEIMELAKRGNKYFDENAPWNLIKKDRDGCGTALHICLKIIKALAIFTAPYLPFSSQKLWNMIGEEGNVHEMEWKEWKLDLKEGKRLEKPFPLFKKLNIDEVIKREEEIKLDFDSIKFEELEELDLRVGEIKSCKQHPNADKLYVLDVDLGVQRQLVAGLKDYYTKEELKNKKIVVVMNLKKAKLRGIESSGMLLAGESKGKIALLTANVKNGERVLTSEKIEFKRITIKDFSKANLMVGVVKKVDDERLEVDFGKSLAVSKGEKSLLGKKVIFALKSIDSNNFGKILFTESGELVGLDRDIEVGAVVC